MTNELFENRKTVISTATENASAECTLDAKIMIESNNDNNRIKASKSGMKKLRTECTSIIRIINQSKIQITRVKTNIID